MVLHADVLLEFAAAAGEGDGDRHSARWSALRQPRAQGTCHGFRKNRYPV
jgi:hypothetical protein